MFQRKRNAKWSNNSIFVCEHWSVFDIVNVINYFMEQVCKTVTFSPLIIFSAEVGHRVLLGMLRIWINKIPHIFTFHEWLRVSGGEKPCLPQSMQVENTDVILSHGTLQTDEFNISLMLLSCMHVALIILEQGQRELTSVWKIPLTEQILITEGVPSTIWHEEMCCLL